MRHHLFTLVLLWIALGLYAAGLSGGGSALLLAGAGFELGFWVRALRMGRQAPAVMNSVW